VSTTPTGGTSTSARVGINFHYRHTLNTVTNTAYENISLMWAERYL